MMDDKFQNKYRVKTIRLQNWDYSTDWYYFITICVKDFKECLGKVEKGKIVLNKIGEIVKEELLNTEKLRDNVKIDEFIIMPNHIHIILVLNNSNVETIINNKNCLNYCRDAINRVSTYKGGITGKHNPMLNNNSLSQIIRSFKAKCSFRIRKLNLSFFWQSRFYEHIIRNEISLEKIRIYIRNNPYKWDIDEYN